MYAPKAKIILQSVALNDPQSLNKGSPADNMAAAKKVLKDYLYVGEVVDDGFFKAHLRHFEPITPEEVNKATQDVLNLCKPEKGDRLFDLEKAHVLGPRLHQYG